MKVKPIDPSGLDPENTPLQSFLWARVKSELGIPSRAFELEERRTLLALLRKSADGGCLAYVPWPENGYIPPDERGIFLEELAGSLAPHLPSNCTAIRFDLPWETPYEAGEDSADFDTADGRPPQRLRELRMNFGTEKKNLRKAPTDIQPADTLLLDIARDRERILEEMKPKTRYNIRLARRRGIVVREEHLDKLGEWYEMYEETTRRKRIQPHDYRNFEALLEESETHAKNYKTRVHLLIAAQEGAAQEDGAHGEIDSIESGSSRTSRRGRALAGIILLRIGTYAMYLYGASRGEGRNLMPTYGLQWEAITRAGDYGCSTYDLFGIPPTSQASHPMHGLYRFKRGFGGKTVHRQGCWDYPLDTEKYKILAGGEPLGPSYHI